MTIPKYKILSILFAVSILLGLTLVGCGPKKEDKLRISTNPWIGYTPLAYAETKGWFENTNISLIWTVSLGENISLFANGRTHGFTATQYEALQFKNNPNLKPYLLIDRSNGADTIHSNIDIEAMKKQSKQIDTYFEINSVNDDLFAAFLEKHNLSKENFKIHHADQGKISSIAADKTPILLISYEPYASAIEKKGFKKIDSTKTIEKIHIIDALFLDEKVAKEREKDIKQLKEIFERAKKALKDNPKEYYGAVKGYLQGQSYEEFLASLSQIEWVESGEQNKKLSEYLKRQGIDSNNIR